MDERLLGRTALLVAAVGLAACASGEFQGYDGGSGGSVDAATAPDARPADAVDAGPTIDAGEPAGTCEACEKNADCHDDSQCVVTGAGRVCLLRCTAEAPDCPDGFMCGGVESTYCAPIDGLCCIDGDDDTYGEGIACAGFDCDDSDPDVHPGASDACNGVDDDCDPTTADGDGDASLGDACDGDDADLCDEGALSCVSGGLVCGDDTGDVVELCNGADDDCDPSTPDGSGEPTLGDACDSDDDDLCDDDALACEGGAIVCADQPSGTADLCDGLDNDCDPSTPDGSGDPAVGVDCDGDDADLCSEGTTVCVDGALECTDDTGDAADVCNGIDDDCDPATLDGSDDPLLGTTCDGGDADLCEEGEYLCSLGALVCTDGSGDNAELCNGLDEDCDPSTPDGADDAGVGLSCDGGDSDLCAEGATLCGAGGAIVCGDETGDTPDLCNAADDDCNPATPDGLHDPAVGLACDGGDADLCADGGTICLAGGVVCDDDPATEVERCDGLDNDCNSATPDGAHEPWLGAACDGPDQGVCAEGTYLCSAGGQVCTDVTGDDLEICNLADDDCDGEVDETFDTSSDVANCGDCGLACTNPHGPTACAGGVCDPTCVGLWGDCDGQPQDGCEQPLDQLDHCGGCGVPCALPHASETCGTGTCQVATCDPGWCNADGGHGNGCERFLDADDGVCTGTTAIGNVRGDEGSDMVSITGFGERWFRVHVSEDSGDLGCDDLGARIRLTPAAGTDYDLRAYCDNCSGADASSGNGGSAMEQVHVRWDEGCIFGVPTGSSSSRDIYIQVLYRSANTCAPYTLEVQGNVITGGNTCSEK